VDNLQAQIHVGFDRLCTGVNKIIR